MNGGPIRKPNEPIEETAAMPGPEGDVRLPAGGAEHQRHAVGDAEPDQEHAHQRRRRLADQQHRGERDAGEAARPSAALRPGRGGR